VGQLVGDWFEEYFALPLLQEVANELRLYLDHRFRERSARGEKIIWKDSDGNGVAYDFVMELNGGDDRLGIPVAFFETCWRRGTRHSKDKARDDVGKLVPMRHAHPTARYVGMVVSGDFTAPAREFVRSREVDLFYIPKNKVVASFENIGTRIDYADKSSEEEKRRIAREFGIRWNEKTKKAAARQLRELLGEADIRGYTDRVRASLGALPQEVRVIAQESSAPRIFATIPEASAFLANPDFDFSSRTRSYVYEVTYSDGAEFERGVETLGALRELHSQLEALAAHMVALRR
jgi:hypothetical protein